MAEPRRRPTRLAEAAARLAGTTTEHHDDAAVGPERNRLLAALPPEELDLLMAELEMVSLGTMEMLAELGGPPDYIYFPLTSIISVIRPAGDGSFIETGTIGCEGAAGITALIGRWSPAKLETQVPGLCLRMPSERFREMIGDLPRTRSVMGTFVLSFIDQAGQSIVCNARHSLSRRCARWMLMAHDRVQGDTFTLTHEVLAQMLAVRRAGVSEAAYALKQAGVIDYRHGKITILDRAGLEAASCECYAINRGHLDALYASEMVEPVGLFDR